MGYHPQTNGLTKCFKKTIAVMLGMYVDIENNTWDEVLSYVTLRTKQRSSKQHRYAHNTFDLVYRRRPNTVLDAMLAHVKKAGLNGDIQGYLRCAERDPVLAQTRTMGQQLADAGRYSPDPIMASTTQGILFGFLVPFDDANSGLAPATVFLTPPDSATRWPTNLRSHYAW